MRVLHLLCALAGLVLLAAEASTKRFLVSNF